MNRACLTKAGKLIEMQSGGKIDKLSPDHTVFLDASIKAKDLLLSQGKTAQEAEAAGKIAAEAAYNLYMKECDALEKMRLNTLKQNALNAGYKEDEIEVRWVTDKEWVEIQEAQKDPVVEWNRPILAQLDALDKKRIRPLAEGDTEYLKGLNEQIIKLRETLRR